MDSDAIFGAGALVLAFLLALSVIRLALAIAEYLDRRDGKDR